MSTEIEFYQRLSEHIPEEAARLIAERMTDRPLEAKVDALDAKIDAKIDGLSARLVAFEAKMEAVLAAMNAKMDTLATQVEVERLRSSFFRWSLAFFVPLWIGTYGTLVAIVVRGTP